ncbi:MAG: hypothetical protein ACYCZW_02255 [Minisyncoccota bacterium]
MSIETFGSLGGFESHTDFKARFKEVEAIKKESALLENNADEKGADQEEIEKLYSKEKELRMKVAVEFLEYLHKINASWCMTLDRGVGGVMSGGMYVREYKVIQDGIEALLQCVYEAAPEFSEGMRKVAEVIGDTELVEKIYQSSQLLDIKYPNLSIRCTVAPKTLFSKPKADKIFKNAGFSYEREVSRHPETPTKIKLRAPSVALSNSPASLDEDLKKRGQEEIEFLIEKLGIDTIEEKSV